MEDDTPTDRAASHPPITKSALRQAALSTRDQLAAHGAEAASAIAALLSDHLAARGMIGQVVAGYAPIGSELDPMPALRALAAAGVQLCLPETPARGLPLLFRRWQPNEPLQPGRFGTRHPAGPPVVPDMLLVPLLAFDRAGNRLGYGAGYYDRTLALLPHAYAIGLAFAGQEVPSVPTGPHDQSLPVIATERGLVFAARAV